jgi:hypothetical protein
MTPIGRFLLPNARSWWATPPLALPRSPRFVTQVQAGISQG